jgi:antitoxin component YwqK of YwqJK toxin-antitoxin module/Tfp pilus assembly protein PilF
MKKIFFAILIGYFSKTYSQTDYSIVYDNDAIINKGITLYDTEKYNEAIIEFDKIMSIDPKFLNAQYEKILSLSALEKKDELKVLLEDLYKKDKMHELPSLYTLYGSFLSDEKEYEKSEKIFEEGEKYLSNSSNFLYNFALLYLRKEENQKCVNLLKRVIINDPNHASSHYLLGLIAFDNGKITEGTLALMSYLIIAPNGRNAEKAILKLNAKFGENYLADNKLVFSKSGDNFEEIETILRNQLPLKSAYKIKSKIDDVVIRQVQAVAEYTLEHKMGDGFFETTYIPWVKNLIERNQFEGFSYYMLLSMESKLGKKLSEQKKKINTFNEDYVLKEFWSFYAKRTLNLFGNSQEVIVSLKNNKPYLIGAQINGKKEGKYKYLNEDGNLNGDLNFQNDALEGIQKYYDEKGNLTEEKSFSNNKLNGTRTTYFSNGSVNLIENYKDDLLEGISTSYYPNGGKQCEINFTNGERDGKFICLYENGTQKSNMVYSKGKLNGAVLNYNELGDLIDSSNYISDQIEGDYFEYYDGKTIKTQSSYSNGKNKNSYKNFYSNSILEKENTFENGKIKTATDFFANGKKSTESLYNENEELESYSYFDTDNNKYFEEKYKSGELKSGLQFSESNLKPVAINLTKNTFELNNFKGVLLVSGTIEKGKKANEWNHNYESGVLRLKEFYSNGKRNGLSTDYYKNSLLNSIKNYTNDTINGTYEVYEEGLLDQTFNYVKGYQNGPSKTFYADGRIKTEGYFTDGNLNFEKRTYWQNGSVAKKENYINNYKSSLLSYNTKGELENDFNYKNKTGKFTFSYNNGTIIEVCNMVNGKLNGKYTIKDKLNMPIAEYEYANGLLNNTYKTYNPLGTIHSERIYYCGKINGTYKQNDLVGNIRLSDENTFGEENGKTIRYYHTKSKMTEYNIINGTVEGEQVYYNQKGDAILILAYNNNSLSYYIRRSKTGALDEKVEVIGETAEIISLYPNGKTAIQMQFVKGSLEGKFIINNNEGKPEFECTYMTNLLNGERIEYYANGSIYKKEHFIKNNYEGSQEYFQEDKKPWLTAMYKNDELHGNTLIYNDGKLVLTKKYDSDELVEIIK